MHDGSCGVIRNGSLLGSFAVGGCIKSDCQRGNAAHLLYSSGLLLLLPGPTGGFRRQRTTMVRPECDRVCTGFRLTIHSSPSWLECAGLASCRKNGTYSQSFAFQVRAILPRDIPHLYSGEPSRSLFE